MANKYESTLKPENIPFKLPNNWRWYRWGDLIIEYQQGLIRSNRELNDTGVRYLKMNNLDNDGGYNLSKIDCTDVSATELKRYKLYHGDFLLNVRNSKELVGKTCTIGSHNFDLVYNHMLVRIKHHDGISGNFINALLKTPVMRKFIDRCKKGTTTVIALYQKDLYEIPIPIPDKITHDSITAFIGHLSRKIELNNQINAELEAMAKTLYEYWFVQFDFPNAKGKPYKSSGGKMVWDDELNREIPKGWDVKSLADIALLISRGISPSYIVSEGIPVLNQKCIRNRSINFTLGRRHDHSLKDASSKLIQIGDVLVNSTGVGTLGRVAIVKRLEEPLTTVDSHVSIVRVDRNKANQSFIGYSLTEKQTEIEALGEGSTGQTELSRDNLGKLKMLLPGSDLQRKFDEFITPTFQKIGINEKENQQLSNLRDWLLPMLMNGQVIVGGYDTAEEEQSYMMAAEPEVEYGSIQKVSIPENKKAFAKQVLAGKIINTFINDPNFTHIKFQKLQYLAEHIAEADLNWNYYRQAAGPYDPAFMHTINTKLKNSKWFEERQYRFHTLAKADQIEGYYQGYFSPAHDKIEQLFKYFATAKEGQVEIVVTLYAVWNNYLIKKTKFTDDDIVTTFFEWSDRKANYTKEQVSKCLNWMKEKNLIPVGWGKLIKEKK